MASANLGVAYIKIAPTMNDFQASVQKAMSQSGKTSGNNFSEGFKASTVAIGSVVGNLMTQALSGMSNFISSNVSNAINRVDELNKFAPTLSNLGVSAEDANDAINLMSDRLTGLPTTLDDAAAAVKKLTARNGDVAKSTDYFLALNDALIAGNAPLDRQSEAMRQLSEAFARGKPDMKEWRILMETMPGQMNQIAEAMGYGAGETELLGEELRKGDVAMEDFLDAFVQLDKEGISGFASLEEQARTASGSIVTSQEVMGAAFSRGIGSIIDTLNGSEKSINNAYEGIGKLVEGVLKGNTEKMKTGTNMLNEVITSFGQKIPMLITGLANSFNVFMNKYFPALFPTFIESLTNVIMAVATALPTVIKSLVQALPLVITTIVENLLSAESIQTLINAAIDIVIAIADALPDIIQALVEAIPYIIDTIVDVLMNPDILAKLLVAGGAIIAALGKALIVAIPTLLISVGEVGLRLISKFAELPGKLPEIGKNLVEGLWNGIKNAGDWIKSKITEFCDGIGKSIKDFFGIHSPSRLMAENGKFIAMGLGEGIEENAKYASDAMKSMSEDVLSETAKFDEDMGSLFGNKFGSTIGTETNAISRNIQQFNTFNQVASDLDVVEASKALGFQVEMAI